jgi:hypothetical protein
MIKYFSIILLILVSSASFSQKKSADLIIRNVHVVDVASGKIIPHQFIAISGEKIIHVGNASSIKNYNAIRSYDATNKFIMPSLWDMHMHFGGDTLKDENEMLLPLFLAMGVTAVRDCAGDISPAIFKWKDQIKQRKLAGPDIFTSGPKLEGINSIWPGDLEIDNEIQLKEALDSLQKLKVDFIKITDNTLKPSLYIESIKQSRARGWKVSGHAPVQFTLQELSEAGMSTIEHIGYLMRAASTEEKEITQGRKDGTITAAMASAGLLQTKDASTALNNFRQLALNGTAIVPTLNGSHIVAYLDKDSHKNDDYLKYIGPALKRTYNWRVERASKDDAAGILNRHAQFEAAATLLPLVEKSGMTILAGTDAGYLNSFNYPGLGLHKELEIMVRYGLTPKSALKASVINGPAFFGLEKDFGAVEAGKKADLLLLNENPLTNIAATKNIFSLIRNGQYLSRKNLDQMLQQVADFVSEKEKSEKGSTSK